MDLSTVLPYLGIGLVGGAFGALVGIAGATFIVPMASLLLAPDTQELRCATMISNVAVAIGAIGPYARAGNIDWKCIRLLAPAAVVAVIVGVLISKDIDPVTYRGLFGIFLVLIVVREFIELSRAARPDRPQRSMPAPVALGAGAAAGMASGVLSVGGGVVLVPVLREFLHFPIKRATGTSIASVLPIVAVGAIVQLWTLGHHPARPDGSDPLTGALKIAACLAPAAVIGGWCGAKLNTHLPKHLVQWTVALGLGIAAFYLLQPFVHRLLQT